MKTIEELKNAQKESLEYFKLNSDRFKSELTKKRRVSIKEFVQVQIYAIYSKIYLFAFLLRYE